MVLAVVRHAESIENADKYRGFYHDRRPYLGAVAHVISRSVVGLTPAGFRQSLWLAEALSDLAGPGLRVYTSTYRRSADTAAIAFDGLPETQLSQTALLDEQHYGDATYMTKQELRPLGHTRRTRPRHRARTAPADPRRRPSLGDPQDTAGRRNEDGQDE